MNPLADPQVRPASAEVPIHHFGDIVFKLPFFAIRTVTVGRRVEDDAVIGITASSFFLYKFAYKRVLTILEDRRQKIAEGVKARNVTENMPEGGSR